MRFDINKVDEPTWFPFDSSNPDGPAVAIRLISVNDLREINKEVTKKEKRFLENKNGDFREVYDIQIDEDKQLELIMDRSICDWRGIEDGKGKPYKIDLENKMLLYFKFDKFRETVDNGRKALRKAEEEREETEKKN